MLILGTCKVPDPPFVLTDSLLLHFNGDDEAVTTTDSSPNNFTMTANGNVELDTAQKKFGTASSYHATYGDYWSTPASAKFEFGTGDFTIEAWVRIPSVVADYSSVIEIQGSWDFWLALRDGHVAFNDEYNYVALEGTTVISVDTWAHIAVCRKSGVMRVFMNGTMEDELEYADDYSGSAAAYIGSSQSGKPFTGHIDEVKIRKEALYDSNFTPSASEY
jgi:hypothetical protein